MDNLEAVKKNLTKEVEKTLSELARGRKGPTLRRFIDAQEALILIAQMEKAHKAPAKKEPKAPKADS